MATRSRIGIKNPDGTVKSVYCHWDGYPDYNGRILCAHYATREAAEALIALGSISSLRERLAPDEGEVHNFDNPKRDITIAYHRDRGEDLEIEDYSDVERYYMSTTDYRYLFSDGKWFVDSTDERNTWVPLEYE
jgi:hypothetical protein